MRIKSDFVTNSSSTAYIMSFDEQEYENFKRLMNLFKRGPFHIVEDPAEHLLTDNITDDPEVIEEFRFESNQGKKLVYIDVSDELGHGFMECTTLSDCILANTEGY